MTPLHMRPRQITGLVTGIAQGENPVLRASQVGGSRPQFFRCNRPIAIAINKIKAAVFLQRA